MRLLTALVLGFCLAACSSSSTAPSTTSSAPHDSTGQYTISGVVAEGSQPVASANVDAFVTTFAGFSQGGF